jgi:ribonuclease HI
MSETIEEFLKSLPPQAKVEIFTDGACSGNPGPGGWGALLRYENHQSEISGGHIQTTNNRMEMLAAISGIVQLPPTTQITLFTDSQYLKDGVTLWMKNWRKNGWITADKRPVKNRDLWERLDQLTQSHTIEWKWVRGHSGHPENERVDALAKKAIIAQRMAV